MFFFKANSANEEWINVVIVEIVNIQPTAIDARTPNAISLSKDVIASVRDAISQTRDCVSQTRDSVSQARDVIASVGDAVSQTRDAIALIEVASERLR